MTRIDEEKPDDRRAYKNPPIVEAIIEFTFSGGEEWNLTVPGLLYERLQDKYPGKPQQREVVEATFGNPEADSPKDAAAITVSRRSERVVFSTDGQLLMAGPNVLSLHGLKPYEGWESLQSRALYGLSVYKKVADPDRITKIGLRYINKIVIPSSVVRFEEYFTVAQGLPKAGFPSNLTSFFDRMEMHYDDIPARINFTWASTKSNEEDCSAFLLDLDLNWVGDTDFGQAVEHLAELHRRERLAFESLITDNSRGIFDAD